MAEYKRKFYGYDLFIAYVLWFCNIILYKIAVEGKMNQNNGVTDVIYY